MMKYYLIIFGAIVILPVDLYCAQWVSFDGTSTPAPPTVEVLSSNDLSTVVQYSIPGVLVEEIDVEGEVYHQLRFHGEDGTLMDVGAPELPTLRRLVGIPAISGMEVWAMSGNYIDLEGYMVYPFQEPLLEDEEPGPFEIDEMVYSTDAFYPDEMGEVSAPGVWRDVRVTALSAHPVLFNPVTGFLRGYYNLTVEVIYTDTTGFIPPLNPPPQVSPTFARLYERMLVNYSFMQMSVDDFSSGYLVIFPDKYAHEIAPLIEWKRRKGVEVIEEEYFSAETLSYAPPDTHWIKEKILQHFSEEGIEYVLLVGTHEDIPLYYNPNPPTRPYPWSDHWYACMDDDDFADVSIGRIPANSEDDVINMVDKIFAYERWPAPDWNVEKAVLVAHKQEYPGKFSRCKRQIAVEIMAESGFEVDTLMGALGASNSDIASAICTWGWLGVVNYRGHGGIYPNRWKEWNIFDESFTTVNANLLINYDRYPVIYNISCHNGAIQDTIEVLAEAFCNNLHGGASGSLGATVSTHGRYNDTMDEALFTASFGGYPAIYNLGGIVTFAKNSTLVIHSGQALTTVRSYLWLGDPEMQLWTGQPAELMASHPESVEMGVATEVTVDVTSDGVPVRDALVCMYKEGEVFERAHTSISGRVVITIFPVTEGAIYVTATKHDHHPYEGIIDIPVGVKDDRPEIKPSVFSLAQNFPNPFNPETEIAYILPTQSEVRLTIYNLLGQPVKVLVDKEQKAGRYSIQWDGRAENGSPVASGVYLYRLKAGAFDQTRKLVVLK